MVWRQLWPGRIAKLTSRRTRANRRVGPPKEDRDRDRNGEKYIMGFVKDTDVHTKAVRQKHNGREQKEGFVL